MTKAWERLIQHQFHDDLPGTSNMDVYNTGWNDYHTSLVQLQGEYTGAVGAIANQLDTQWVTDCALIVHRIGRSPCATESQRQVPAGAGSRR